jgi:hypothetical protein
MYVKPYIGAAAATTLRIERAPFIVVPSPKEALTISSAPYAWVPSPNTVLSTRIFRLRRRMSLSRQVPTQAHTLRHTGGIDIVRDSLRGNANETIVSLSVRALTLISETPWYTSTFRNVELEMAIVFSPLSKRHVSSASATTLERAMCALAGTETLHTYEE